LRAETDEQQSEITRLRREATEASSELADLAVEAEEHHRRQRAMNALVARLRSEARVREEVITRQLAQLAADELELDDLRGIRDALTPPKLASRPGVEVAASFLPATEGVSGDFYLVAAGPNDATTVVVGDVVGKGHDAARRASFIRTVLLTTVPFSDDPAQLLSWANTALLEGAAEVDADFVTVGCVTFSPGDRVLRWAYAGHPPMLRLDSGDELSGGRGYPLGLSRDWECAAAAHLLPPGSGVLLYTDGVTEARRDGEQFGEARLVECIQQRREQPPSEVVAAVTADVQAYAAPSLADDLCVVAARIGAG
jgi:serine phosphatase RsbU (regulator of sigma subunit)